MLLSFTRRWDRQFKRPQLGEVRLIEVNFLAGLGSLRKPAPAAILQFPSNKIARPVRSSMAAGSCCSLAAAADKLIIADLQPEALDALLHGDTTLNPEWSRRTTEDPGPPGCGCQVSLRHLQGTPCCMVASARRSSLDSLPLSSDVAQYADCPTKAMPGNSARLRASHLNTEQKKGEPASDAPEAEA